MNKITVINSKTDLQAALKAAKLTESELSEIVRGLIPDDTFTYFPRGRQCKQVTIDAFGIVTIYA